MAVRRVWLRGLGETDVAIGFVRAVDAEVACDIAGIGDAIGDQGATRLADADQAELAAEIGIGPVELLVAVGFGDVLPVQPDQHADGDAVVELRLAREIDADLLAHRHGLAVEIAETRGGDAAAARGDLRRRAIAETAADRIVVEAVDAELQAAGRHGLARHQSGGHESRGPI